MTMDLGTLAILFPMLFLLLGLGVTVVIDPYIQQKQRRIMLLIVVLCLSLIVQNLWENELFVSHSHLALKNLLSAYGYSVRPVFLVLFLYRFIGTLFNVFVTRLLILDFLSEREDAE